MTRGRERLAARRHELARTDARARAASQQVFDAPLVLEAGAGTGKTTALVARIVAWSLGPGWLRSQDALRREASAHPGGASAPERIAVRVLGRVVAITFTEAAAAEMGARVGETLRAIELGELPLGLLAESLPAAAQARARALRGALDHLVVHTIHAYCRRLLATHPLEVGLHPRLEVDAEGRAQAQGVREVLERRLADAYAEPGDPALLALAARGVGPFELETEILGLLDAGLPSAALEPDTLAASHVRALARRVRSGLEAFLAADGGILETLRRGRVAQQTAALVDRTRARMADGAPADADQLAELAARVREEWTGSHRERLRKWSRDEFTAGECEALGERASGLRAASAALLPLLGHLGSLEVELLARARPAVRALLDDVEAELRARGVASFAALLTGARDLLAAPEVAARVRSGIDQLLVDEFQDTDRRQCEIVAALALQGAPDERPGLLLVGDPKQSIYGWRSADLAAYDGFVRQTLAAGGRRERLSVNHRSAPAILDEVERAIAPIMSEREGVQPAFQPLVPSDQTAAGTGFARGRFAAVEYWVSAAFDRAAGALRQTSAAEASQLEAAALARDLRAIHDEHGAAWGRIGVLFRTRSDWEVYLRALREAGVPFAVEGDRSYYQRREVIEAAGLVRCVLDPNDHLALLTVLRSAAVGVPDAAIVPLWARRLPERLGALQGAAPGPVAELRDLARGAARSLPEGVPGLERVRGWERNLVALAEALGRLRESFDREPADVFVERLRTLTLFEASEAARTLGAWRSANLERFFRRVTEVLAGGGSAQELLRALRVAVAGREEASEARPAEILEDAVQVMTIHGAKGLDFEHVYVMQLHKGAGSGAARELRTGEIDGRVEYQLFGAPTPGFDLVVAERERVVEAERVRTLYVALTRARERLVLAGLWTGFRSRRGNGAFAELLTRRDAPAPEFSELAARLAAVGRDRADASHARFVFPALAAAGPGPAGTGPAPRALPEVGQVEASSRRLVAERARAAARMRRPLAARASGGAGVEAVPGSGDPGERPAVSPEEVRGPPGASAARHAGTAVHRVLEGLDLSAEREAELARGHEALPRVLAALLPPGAERDAALGTARQLLERFAAGPLAARLWSLGEQVVARELPVLLPAESGEEGAVGYVAGSVDLLYRDSITNEWVVADYKTDRMRGEGAVEARARSHAAQGRVYRRAIAEAFGLAREPRFELWFVAAGCVVAPSADSAPDPGETA